MSKITGYIKKHKTLTVVISVALILVILIVALSGGSAQPAVVFPDVITLTRMDLSKIVPATGDVESITNRQVSVSSAFKIIEISVSEGDAVSVGDTLAQLDTTDLDEQISDLNKTIESTNGKLATAENSRNSAKSKRDAEAAKQDALIASVQTQLTSAKTIRDQAKIAWDGNPGDTALQAAYDAAVAAVGTLETALETAKAAKEAALAPLEASLQSAQSGVDSIKDSLTSLKSQMATLQKQRGDCTIKAPINGIVTTVNAKMGAMPNAAMPLFVVEDLSKLQIKVTVPEYDMLFVQKGQPVEITSDAQNDASWTGVVTAISPVATDIDHNFTVTIAVSSELGRLTSGMSAKVNIVCEKKLNIFAVPYDAVVKNSSGQQVIYVVDLIDGANTNNTGNLNNANMYDMETRREIVVQTGMESDYYIEIIGDALREGLYVLSDPESHNASSSSGGGMFTFGPGGGA